MKAPFFSKIHTCRKIYQMPCLYLPLNMKKSAAWFYLILLAAVLAFFSCSPEDIDPAEIPSGTEYYPVEVGRFWIYRVDTTAFTFSGDTLSGTYFLKEIIKDTLLRQEGHPVFRTELYKTADTAMGWRLDSVWSLRADPDKILKTENNRPLVKLRFPLSEGSNWDINQYNTLQDNNGSNRAIVKNLGQNYSWNGQNYPSLQVLQKSDSNCVSNQVFFETYLKNIGLVFRKRKAITFDLSESDACSKPIRKIQIGYDKNYVLLKTGKE
jgi:hypothetical protein